VALIVPGMTTLSLPPPLPFPLTPCVHDMMCPPVPRISGPPPIPWPTRPALYVPSPHLLAAMLPAFVLQRLLSPALLPPLLGPMCPAPPLLSMVPAAPFPVADSKWPSSGLVQVPIPECSEACPHIAACSSQPQVNFWALPHPGIPGSPLPPGEPPPAESGLVSTGVSEADSWGARLVSSGVELPGKVVKRRMRVRMGLP
jgi:hypothetical protein